MELSPDEHRDLRTLRKRFHRWWRWKQSRKPASKRIRGRVKFNSRSCIPASVALQTALSSVWVPGSNGTAKSWCAKLRRSTRSLPRWQFSLGSSRLSRRSLQCMYATDQTRENKHHRQDVKVENNSPEPWAQRLSWRQSSLMIRQSISLASLIGRVNSCFSSFANISQGCRCKSPSDIW